MGLLEVLCWVYLSLYTIQTFLFNISVGLNLLKQPALPTLALIAIYEILVTLLSINVPGVMWLFG